MARLTVVKKSRKAFKCMGPCGKEIPVGSGYRRWRMNFRPDHVRCMDCPTPPRSFFTTSEIYAMAWDIQDGGVPEIETYDDLSSAAQDLGEQIREIENLIQEKLDNIEQGMGHSYAPIYSELEERKYGYESWADEVEAVPNSFDEEEFDSEAAREALEDALSNSPE